MALLWPADADSLLFQACLTVGVLVLVVKTALPAALRRRMRHDRLLRAPVLPPREFQRRRRALQQEARTIRLELAAARSLKRQRLDSRSDCGERSGTPSIEAAGTRRRRTGQRGESREAACAKKRKEGARAMLAGDAVRNPLRPSMRKRRQAGETRTRKYEAVYGETTRVGDSTLLDTEALPGGTESPKPMVLVAPIDTPPRVRLRCDMDRIRQPLRGREATGGSDQRLMHWEDPSDSIPRDAIAAATRSAPASLGIGSSTSQAPNESGDRKDPRSQRMRQPREERKQEEDREEEEPSSWPMTQVQRNTSMRLGISADMDEHDSPDSSMASLIGARQRPKSKKRPLPTSSLPAPRRSRIASLPALKPSVKVTAIKASALLRDDTHARLAPRWPPRIYHGSAGEKKGGEEAGTGGDKVAMKGSNRTHRADAAEVPRSKRRVTEKRLHEQAFTPAPAPRRLPQVVVVDKTPQISRRITFDDDGDVKANETDTANRVKLEKHKTPTLSFSALHSSGADADSVEPSYGRRRPVLQHEKLAFDSRR